MRASVRDVANKAGVSAVTVSNVLNGRGGRASNETQKRVFQAVRELNYIPVRQPATQRRHVATRIISLVFDGTSIEDLWGLPTFYGLREAALQRDYDLLVLLRSRPDWMVDQEELQFLDRRSDGFIFIVPENRRQVIETLVEHGIPAVACYTTDVPPAVPTVVLDNSGAMQMMVQHLIEAGHQRILHVTVSKPRTDFQERQHGYEKAMREAGLKPRVLTLDSIYSEDAASTIIKTIRKEKITAAACAADAMAVQLWDIAEIHGIMVPHDLSLTGMDNLPMPAQRGLTSIHFSCEEIGRRAIEVIVDLIEGGETASEKHTDHCIVPVELVSRSSVAPPAT